MYTSDNTIKGKTLGVYIGFTVFCAIFGIIYEIFSHEVYSVFMMFAFAVPLLLGVVPVLIIKLKKLRKPDKLSYRTWNSGVAAITIGSLFEGVLEIYGTTNKLIMVYPIVGVPLLIVGFVSYIVCGKKEKSEIAPVELIPEYRNDFV